jgi:drug/metabolite transporter (DMT)-like permease
MRRPTPRDVAILCLIGAMWGGTFPALKIAVAHIPPVGVAAGRLLVAAAFMVVIAWVAGAHRLPASRDVWLKYLAIATVGNVLPFILIADGQQYIEAGLSAILMATMPLATLLLSPFFVKDELLTFRRVAGVAVGLVGMLLLVGVDALQGLGSNVLAQVKVAAGAVCYAVHSIIIRRITGVSPLTNTACALVLSALISVPLAFATADIPVPPIEAIVALVFAGMMGTALGYLLYMRLVADVGVNFAALCNYLVPVFGILWSALVLAERPSMRAIAALCLILGGIALTQVTWRRNTAAPQSPSTSRIE